jgi:DNA polymerase III alpha subunit (gram-positive type)
MRGITRWWTGLLSRLSDGAGPPIETLRTAGFVAIDLETTGLDSARDAIVSVAAIPFVGGMPQPGYVTLVNPGRPIPPASTRIHGIRDSDVADAPHLDAVLPQLDSIMGERVVVGHGIDFDLAIIARERRARRRARRRAIALDTLRLAAAVQGEARDFELESVAARLGVTVVGRHTARGDALAAGQILIALLPALSGAGIRTLRDARRAQRDAAARVLPSGRF